jgi:hypothetical protein
MHFVFTLFALILNMSKIAHFYITRNLKNNERKYLDRCAGSIKGENYLQVWQGVGNFLTPSLIVLPQILFFF